MDFFIPHSTYSKKNFISFWVKGKKMEETAQYFEKQFFKIQISDFHIPSKILATHRNYEILSKSLVPNQRPNFPS
jgi:hypothetical protein